MNNMNHELHHPPSLDPAGARPVGRVGIVGAGPTGIAVALQLLDADVPVTFYEPDADALREAMAQIRSASTDMRDMRLALLAGTVNFHHLKDADLIIDTGAAADGEQLFHRLDQTAKHGAILATAAVHAGVDPLAGATRRPDDVLGLRLNRGQAWELLPGRETSGAALATVSALARQVQGPAAAAA